jgi:hypothetical protein
MGQEDIGCPCNLDIIPEGGKVTLAIALKLLAVDALLSLA